MTITLSSRLDEHTFPVVAASDLLLTSTVGDTRYISLKNYLGCMVLISIADGTTVTGSTVTLKQATAVAGTGEKALAFNRMLASVDYPTTALAETTVTSNTFTTQTTNSKNSFYVIDVKADSLDVDGNFDCFRVDGTGHAATASRGVCVIYIPYGARNSGASPLVD